MRFVALYAQLSCLWKFVKEFRILASKNICRPHIIISYSWIGEGGCYWQSNIIYTWYHMRIYTPSNDKLTCIDQGSGNTNNTMFPMLISQLVMNKEWDFHVYRLWYHSKVSDVSRRHLGNRLNFDNSIISYNLNLVVTE